MKIVRCKFDEGIDPIPSMRIVENRKNSTELFGFPTGMTLVRDGMFSFSTLEFLQWF